MATVAFEKVTLKHPTSGSPAVKELDLQIADGEFVCVVGPTGCGKSSTIRVVAGLELLSGGRVYIGGQDVSELPAWQRDIAIVSPNRATALRGLDRYLDSWPAHVVRARRLRVTVIRALERRPQVLLMDEACSTLHATRRVPTWTAISATQRRLGVTTIYVTRDHVEAMTMADRIAVLHRGELQQFDTPEQVHARPATAFVAGFLGAPAMNLLEFDVTSAGEFAYGNLGIALTRAQKAALTSPRLVVGSRPESVRTSRHDGPGIPATVDQVEQADNGTYLHLTTREPTPRTVTVRPPADGLHRVGEAIRIRPSYWAMHLFDQATGTRLPDYSSA